MMVSKIIETENRGVSEDIKVSDIGKIDSIAVGGNLIYHTYEINKDIIERLSKADPKNVQEVAASQIQLLNNYYSLVIDQSNKSFRWALIAAMIGLGFFLASVGFILYNQQETVAIISLISGSLIEVISGINFYLYGKTSNQLSEFHYRLDLTQRYLLANSVCESLEGDFKQNARSELVKTIAGSKLIN